MMQSHHVIFMGDLNYRIDLRHAGYSIVTPQYPPPPAVLPLCTQLPPNLSDHIPHSDHIPRSDHIPYGSSLTRATLRPCRLSSKIAIGFESASLLIIGPRLQQQTSCGTSRGQRECFMASPKVLMRFAALTSGEMPFEPTFKACHVPDSQHADVRCCASRARRTRRSACRHTATVCSGARCPTASAASVSPPFARPLAWRQGEPSAPL